jgi:hypothetical protein
LSAQILTIQRQDCLLVWADEGASHRQLSAIEQGPALLIAQPLVIEHKISDLAGKLVTLLLAFQATSFLTLIFRSRRAYSPDHAGRCAEFVSRHMGDRHGLTGGVSRFLRGAEYLYSRRVSGRGDRAGLSHRNLARRAPVRLPGADGRQ